jgi:hypothetical protein
MGRCHGSGSAIKTACRRCFPFNRLTTRKLSKIQKSYKREISIAKDFFSMDYLKELCKENKMSESRIITYSMETKVGMTAK